MSIFLRVGGLVRDILLKIGTTAPRSAIDRYVVFNRNGHALALWETREQAESFLHPGTGRYVEERADPN